MTEVMSVKKKIGEILRSKGWATEEQVQKALEYQRANPCKIGEALVRILSIRGIDVD